MLKSPSTAEDAIQEYLHGELPRSSAAAFESALLEDPQLALRVRLLQRQNKLLHELRADILDEPVPERLAAILRSPQPVPLRPHSGRKLAAHSILSRKNHRARRFSGAPAILLTLAIGFVLGWGGNTALTKLANTHERLARDLIATYQLYATDQNFPLLFAADRTAEFSTWIVRSFGRTVTPPDLTTEGFQYIGGTLAVGSDTRTGAFFYVSNSTATRIAAFFWPGAKAEFDPWPGASRTNSISARFAYTDGLNFAILSSHEGAAFDPIANAIFARLINGKTS